MTAQGLVVVALAAVVVWLTISNARSGLVTLRALLRLLDEGDVPHEMPPRRQSRMLRRVSVQCFPEVLPARPALIKPATQITSSHDQCVRIGRAQGREGLVKGTVDIPRPSRSAAHRSVEPVAPSLRRPLARPATVPALKARWAVDVSGVHHIAPAWCVGMIWAHAPFAGRSTGRPCSTQSSLPPS